MLRAIILAVVVTISMCSSLLYADEEPGSQTHEWWVAQGNAGKFTKYFGLDANSNIQWMYYDQVYVDSSPDAAHACTALGNALDHAHHEFDLIATDITLSNTFWDWFYQAGPLISDVNRAAGSSSSNQWNCYCAALKGGEVFGVYDYWIETDQAEIAFNEGCNQIDLANKAAKDIMFYKIQNHSSILAGIFDEENTYAIVWKNGASPIYMYTATGLNTPGRINQNFVQGFPAGGTFVSNAGGAEEGLEPAGKLQRAK